MTSSSPPRTERLTWLDLTRLLCATMILGFHWLRACFKLGLSGPSGFNLVMNYQGNTGGLRFFHDVFIAGFSPEPTTWLTNIIGLLGGVGWEAVSALVLISGFSLALSDHGRARSPADWAGWYRKRAIRILVPFYLLALPALAAAGAAIVVFHYVPGHVAAVIEAKLLSQFQTPLLGVALSHTVLFDPFARQWSANFFVPAWWFIPAILVAYLTYPLIRRASRIRHGAPLLALSALVTIAAYVLSNLGVLYYECWYFIALHECFNFSLGVVLAGAWTGGGRAAIERVLDDPRACGLALCLFIAGNVANWTDVTRPIASMIFGPSLVLLLAFLARRLAPLPNAQRLLAIDPYDLYLIHQPFAFPIALAASAIFHGYAVFFGWFGFVAIAVLASRVLSFVQRPLVAAPNPVARAISRLRALRAS
jgi:hypothetical protein